MDHAPTADLPAGGMPADPAPASAPAAPARAVPSGPPAASELDRIREILFGAQQRDYDLRFNAIEDRIVEGLSALDRQVAARQHEYDVQVRTCFDELRRRLAADNQRFGELIAGLSEELRQLDWRLQEQNAMQRSRVDTVRSELQQSMATSLVTLESQVNQAYSNLGTRLSIRIDSLEQASVERRTLADALDSIARELRGSTSRETV